MSKSLSVAQLATLSRTENVRMLNFLKITWAASDIVWYGDSNLSWSGVTAIDKLLEISEISYKLVNRKSTVVGTVSVKIIDVDKTIFNRLKSKKLERLQAVCYQHFENLTAPTDFIQIYAGEIASPVSYDEVQRVVSFDIIPPLKAKVIPFSASEDGTSNADNNVEEEFRGAAFPTVFGKALDVPAQRVYRGPRMFLSAAIDESNSITVSFDTENPSDSNPFSNPTTSRDYLLGEEYVTGSFGTGSNAKKFTFTTRNKAKITGTTALRPNPAVDPDANLPTVLWTTTRIVGKWVTLTGNAAGVTPTAGFENYCYKQVGNKCFFTKNWSTSAGVNSKVASGHTFNAQRYDPSTGTRWTHQQGTTLRLTGEKAIYVINDCPVAANANSDGTHSEVVRVRAYRQVPIVGGPTSGQTTKQLVKVPEVYYNINRNSSVYSHPLNTNPTHKPVLIEFDPPLEDRGQGWDEQIYVSLASDITTGTERSITEQIKYILANYTDLVADATTFAAVNSLVSNFSADWALLEAQDAIQVCIDMAWQARCGLIIEGSTVKIKYLSVGDPGAGTDVKIDNTSVVLDSATLLEDSELEDLITVFDAKYKDSYLNSEMRTLTKRTNTAIYPERKETFNFTIYQSKSLVTTSRNYWADIYGNIWRKLKLTCLLPAFVFDPLDTPNINLDDILGWGGFVRGRIEDAKYNYDGTVDFVIWLPIKVAQTAVSGWNSIIAPSTVNPFASIEGNPPLADDIEALANSQDGS